jgi:hypothetical protein
MPFASMSPDGGALGGYQIAQPLRCVYVSVSVSLS